jgi:ferritin-like metal-binding protein YciE
MAVQSPTQLFLEEMGSMYSAEQIMLQTLPQLAKESNNQQATNAFQVHEQETRQQVQNLEQCFQILGERPPKVACYAMAGLKQEHDEFVKENPTQDILTAFDLDATCKTEYFEMASYKGLIDKANMMGQTQIVNLLQQNFQQEQAMAQRAEQLCRQVDQQIIQKVS